MAYSLTYLLSEWQLKSWKLNADGDGVREFKTLMLRDSLKSSDTSWNFGHFYIEVLFGLQRRRVEFDAEDSCRGASNNLKVIVPAVLSHVCRNSRWSWESATKQLHDNVGEVVRLWRPFWGEVRNDSNCWRRCRRLNCFRSLNTSPGVVGGQRTSTNRDKLFDSRPAVLPPFIVCRLNGASTCIIVYIAVVFYTPICVHLLLSLIHIWRCRRSTLCRSRWSPYH